MNQVAHYVMNPAEDTILFGDELRDGMLVMHEDWVLRGGSAVSEDEQLRNQRFMRVTRLRFVPGPAGDLAVFIGEWVDGHQKVQRVAVTLGWIVKKASIPDYTAEDEG